MTFNPVTDTLKMLKTNEKSEIVTAAQVALGEKYAAPFWDEVSGALDQIEGDKPKVDVKPRWTKPATIGHY